MTTTMKGLQAEVDVLKAWKLEVESRTTTTVTSTTVTATTLTSTTITTTVTTLTTLTTTTVPPLYLVAEGGTITEDGRFKIHTFTSSGSFKVVQLGDSGNGADEQVEYLVIAGGGSGGVGIVVLLESAFSALREVTDGRACVMRSHENGLYQHTAGGCQSHRPRHCANKPVGATPLEPDICPALH
jgi:hypothetical protein